MRMISAFLARLFSCWGSSSESSEVDGSWRDTVNPNQVNESLYELKEPRSAPNMVILFFHGFYSTDSENAHFSTWQSEDGSSVWPDAWLVEKFPSARILYVSYKACLEKSHSGADFDMHTIVENLASDLVMAKIGQTPDCPVILVGYCFGGLVIKQLCLHINARKISARLPRERTRLESFLRSVKGVFYYGTPHNGSPCIQNSVPPKGSPLLKYFVALNQDAGRVSYDFARLWKNNAHWMIHGLGELLPTNRGPFKNVVVASDGAARDGDLFNLVEADHISISRARSPIDRRFRALYELLQDIAHNSEENRIGHQCQGLPSYPIALQKRAKDCEEKLKRGAILGVLGMGGIGKTAIAKQVYNNISRVFQYTCFVDDAKGKSYGLNEYILSHFYQHGRKVDRIEWFELKEKRTLIVLDDIDSEDQPTKLPELHNFGAGSKIIITSRDKEVFKAYKSYDIYDVEFLKGDEAKMLFCQHVFGLGEIPEFSPPMNHLSKNVGLVVDKCGGLPLTIEVMGRYLRGHEADAEVWEETIDKLGKAQAISGSHNDRLWASLKVSYDALAEEEQEMFIEAATYFFAKPLDRALAAWSTTTENSKTRWSNLVNRSLVKEVWEEHFNHVGYRMAYKVVWLHEQLKDLATSLAKGYLKSASHREADEVLNLLNTKEHIKPDIRILKVNSSRTIVEFLELGNLKYLDFTCVNMHNRLGQNFPRKVSVLRWRGRSFQGSLTAKRQFNISLNKMTSLAILELSDWDVSRRFVKELGNLRNLRILSLFRIRGLERLPENLGNLSHLKHVELRDVDLQTFPESFGSLSALEQLTLDDVTCLQLPESFGNLQSLKILGIARCKRLSSLPSSFGNLLRLENVCVENCPLLESLPPSFSQLSGLQQLAVYHCKRLRDLGDSFGALSSLRLLILNSTGIGRLPDSFGLLSALEELTLGEPGPLRELPDNFGQLNALKILDMACAQLETLPNSFCLLRSLQNLTILSRTLTSLPENLGDLSQLEKLHLVVDCVKALPESLGRLSPVLQRLTVYAESLERLPTSMGQLSSLQHLWIYCPKLGQLPDSLGDLSSLEILAIGSMELDDLPRSTVRYQLLRFLYLRAESMSTLPETIGELASLPEFQSSCDWHDRMLDDFDEPSSSVVLFSRMNDSRPEGEHSLPPPDGLTFGMQRLEKLPDQFGKLKSLRKLKILNCNMLEGLPDSLGNITSLREITLDTCARLRSLPSSWGRQGPSQVAPAQKEKGRSTRFMISLPFSRTVATEGLQLVVKRCPYLGSSVVRRLGWVAVKGERDWLVPHYRECGGRCCGRYTRRAPQ